MKEREFKGIWIPKEIWLSADLTIMEKIFLVEIDSLDNEKGCFASNDYFSKFFDLSKSRVSEIINSLVHKNYISSIVNSDNGNSRVLNTLSVKRRIPYEPKGDDPISEKANHNNTFNNTVNNTKNTVYQLSVDFWLKEFHIGWIFNATTGKKMKSIISKLKKVMEASDKPTENDENVFNAFKYMCLNLPEYYKDKDLQVIDSKFNEILTEIKNGKNGKKDSNNKQVSKYR